MPKSSKNRPVPGAKTPVKICGLEVSSAASKAAEARAWPGISDSTEITIGEATPGNSRSSSAWRCSAAGVTVRVCSKRSRSIG